jgi:hypothetical protein
MFAFFVGEEFKGFWGNSPGDIFFDLTCDAMDWEKSITSLVYFPKFHTGKWVGKEVEVSMESLIVKEKTIENEQEILNTVKTYQPDVFVHNGLILIPC